MANEVVINVKADTSKAGKNLDGMRDKLKKVGAAATVAGGAIVAFGVSSLKSFAEAGDEIHKMSIRTGFSAETLSELRLAAELSGTSLKALETGVRKMQMAIVDAGEGVAISVDAFDKMGLTFDDVKGKTPEKQFEILTQAMAKMEKQEEKVSVAMDIFGKAGTAMLPMLADGEEGLKAMKEQAHELGLVFDEEAAAKAAVLNDAVTTMSGAMDGVKMKIAEALAPAVSDLAIRIEKGISKFTEWAEKNPELADTLAKVTFAIGAVLLVIGPLAVLMGTVNMLLPGLIAGFGILTGPIGLVVLAVAALGVAWATNFGGIREKTEAVFGFIKRLYDSHLGWVLPGGQLIKAIVFLKDNWKQVWNTMMEHLRNTINSMIGMVNILIRALNTIQVPDWVPIIGGRGVNIPEIGLIQEGWGKIKPKPAAVVNPAQQIGNTMVNPAQQVGHPTAGLSASDINDIQVQSMYQPSVTIELDGEKVGSTNNMFLGDMTNDDEQMQNGGID